jgi:hypothetical protein
MTLSRAVADATISAKAVLMAATNKSLARSNKSRTQASAINH